MFCKGVNGVSGKAQGCFFCFCFFERVQEITNYFCLTHILYSEFLCRS